MLYELNKGEINYNFTLFKKKIINSGELTFIDFEDEYVVKQIKMYIYKKIYNMKNETAGKSVISKIDITKQEKRLLKDNIDEFLRNIIKKDQLFFLNATFLHIFTIFLGSLMSYTLSQQEKSLEVFFGNDSVLFSIYTFDLYKGLTVGFFVTGFIFYYILNLISYNISFLKKLFKL